MAAPSEAAGRSQRHAHPTSWFNPPISAAARACAQEADAALTRYSQQAGPSGGTAENQRLADHKYFLQ